MDNLYYDITLDLMAKNRPRVKFKQLDSKRGIRATITADGSVYNIAAVNRFEIYIRRPDGNPIYNTAAVSDGKVTYIFNDSATAVSGIALAEIRMLDNNNAVLSSLPFEIDIDASVYDVQALVDTQNGDILKNMSEAATTAANTATTKAAQATQAAQEARSYAESINPEMLLHYRGELTGSNALNLAVEEGYYFIPAGTGISMLGNGAAMVQVTKGDVGGAVGILQTVTGANTVATRAVYNLSLIDQIPFVVYPNKEYVDAQLATKVSIAAMNAALAAKANTADMNAALANKVDKVSGQGLSTNDYTNAAKTKVDLIKTADSGDKALADNGAYKYPVWCETDYNFNSGELVVGDGSHKVKRSGVQMDDLALKTYVDSAIQTSITTVMGAGY